MKATTTFFKFVLAGLFLSIVNLAIAQQGHRPGPPETPDEAQLDKMMNKLKAELKLSDEQLEKMKSLHIAHFEKIKKMHEKDEKQSEAVRKQREELRANFESEIEKVLNKEQYKKFVEMMKDRKPPHPRERPKKKG